MTSSVALAVIATFTLLLNQHWQQYSAECWSLSIPLRDFIATWTLQLDRPTDRYIGYSDGTLSKISRYYDVFSLNLHV